MLPDFPALKESFNRAVTLHLQERTKLHQGFLGTINRGRIFEGRNHVIARQDGTEEPLTMNKSSSELRIPLDDIKSLGLQQLLERLDVIAQDMARQQSEGIFKSMSEGSKKAGTTVDAQGKPFTPDLLLTALEKMWIDFGPDGSPHMPTIVMSPIDAERIGASKGEEDPEFAKRLEAVMGKKREEWNAREADRVLVG